MLPLSRYSVLFSFTLNTNSDLLTVYYSRQNQLNHCFPLRQTKYQIDLEVCKRDDHDKGQKVENVMFRSDMDEVIQIKLNHMCSVITNISKGRLL